MFKFDPLKDGKSSLELIDFMGGDLAIVNDARTSFDRESLELDGRDIKLLNYLIKHKHYSTLRSTVFKFKVVAPLFICRQWYKHAVASSYTEMQSSWNEKSLRYTDLSDNAEFYIPLKLRQQSQDNRQASIEANLPDFCIAQYELACTFAYETYKELINEGVCREQARAVLPAALYTTFVWTVSLQALMNFIELRRAAGAQYEIAAYTKVLACIVETKAPHAYRAFTDSCSDL